MSGSLIPQSRFRRRATANSRLANVLFNLGVRRLDVPDNWTDHAPRYSLPKIRVLHVCTISPLRTTALLSPDGMLSAVLHGPLRKSDQSATSHLHGYYLVLPHVDVLRCNYQSRPIRLNFHLHEVSRGSTYRTASPA